jgi:peptide/nickel transport system substrate-binding protein
MRHRSLARLVFTTLVSAVLLAPTLAFAQSGEKVIRVALTGPITTLDPANHRSRLSENVIRNMFDGLYTVATTGELLPEIAEGVTQVADTVWEFKIRQGITFHNGDPLTAEDVAFSYNRVVVEGAMEGQTSPRKGLMGSLESVEIVDDYTVRFHLGAPESQTRVLTSSVFMQVIPKTYFESVGVDAFIANPVGSGPFTFVEANYAERIVLERFDDYFGGAPGLLGEPGPAPADRIIFEVIPDPTSRLAALRAGDVDIIQGVLADQVSVIERDPNVVLKTAPGTNPVFLAFTTTRAPFDDARVRRALAYAIDYDLLVSHVFGGLADPLYGLTTIWNSEVPHPDQVPYTYDPERAKELLAEAGVTDLELVIDSIGTWNLVAEAVAQMLRDIGIDAQTRVWDLGAMQEAARAGDRQAIIHTWGNASGNPAWPVFPNQANSGYTLWTENEEFWDIMSRAPSIVDVAEREAAFRRAYDIHNEEMPLITIVLPMTLEAVRSNVRDFESHPGGRVNMHRVDIVNP